MAKHTHYAIEKNVPLPDARSTGLTATLRALKVGESFLVPPRQRNSIYTAATNLGISVAVRTEGFSLRVWRIAPIDSTKEAA